MIFIRCLVFEFVHKPLLFIVSGNDIEQTTLRCMRNCNENFISPNGIYLNKLWDACY
jgi:hypothetical protein